MEKVSQREENLDWKKHIKKVTLLAVASTLNEPEPEFKSLENRVRSRTLCFFRRNHYGRWCIGVNFSQKKVAVCNCIITAEDLRTFLRWDKPKTLLESNVACLWESWFWLCFSKHLLRDKGGGGELKVVLFFLYILDILFSSNHNIHKSSYSLRIWASDHLINRS